MKQEEEVEKKRRSGNKVQSQEKQDMGELKGVVGIAKGKEKKKRRNEEMKQQREELGKKRRNWNKK